MMPFGGLHAGACPELATFFNLRLVPMVPGTKITGITWRGGTMPSARAWKLLGLHTVSKPGSPFSSKLRGTRRVACERGGGLLISTSPRRWLRLNDISRGDAIIRAESACVDQLPSGGVKLSTTSACDDGFCWATAGADWSYSTSFHMVDICVGTCWRLNVCHFPGLRSNTT